MVETGGFLVDCPEECGWPHHPAHLGVQKATSALASQPHGMASAWTSAFMPCPRGLKQQKEKDTTAVPALRL